MGIYFVLFFHARPYNNGMKKSIYASTAIVTGLSAATRGLGFLYRVVLSRLIGAEGLGILGAAGYIGKALFPLCGKLGRLYLL